MSIAKYKVAQNTTENPRQTEYRLFAVVTKSLLASNGKERRDPEFFKAVDWNRRLWMALQTDLMQDENGFPDSLKAQIISLAIWVDKHSRLAQGHSRRRDP